MCVLFTDATLEPNGRMPNASAGAAASARHVLIIGSPDKGDECEFRIFPDFTEHSSLNEPYGE